MLIFDEVSLVEQIIKEKQKPVRMSVQNLIRYIARYYYDDCKDMNAKEYARYVLDIIKKIDIPATDYQEYQYAKFTMSYCKNLLSGLFPHTLRQVREIYITQKEMDIIDSAAYRKERKVIFTLYVIAKAFSHETGWVNASEADIFALANVNVSNDEKMEIMHALYKDGLIQVNHIIDKSGYQVQLFPDSDNILKLTELKNFGNQYVVFKGKGIKMCKKCGKIYKIKNPYERHSKYCPKCRNLLF